MRDLIKLLEVIIWPATLLIIIYIFRSQFKSVFSRVKDFQANASGVSMSFSEKLEATKKLAQNLSIQPIAKSTIQIRPDDRLLELRSLTKEVEDFLIQKGQSANIDIKNKSAQEINEVLKEKGILRFDKSELIKAFNELTRIENKNISEIQLVDLKKIVQSIKS